MRGCRGFTLIELLVVIAVIAVLAAILFPVFAQAREKARQTSCLANINQMVKAAMMYKDDADGYYPQLWFQGPRTDITETNYWYVALYPYVKSWQVFVCPSCAADNRFTGPGKSRVAEDKAIIGSTCDIYIPPDLAPPNGNVAELRAKYNFAPVNESWVGTGAMAGTHAPRAPSPPRALRASMMRPSSRPPPR
jgi:prepilin-type N-terminal cleavage/methylation domain-containing protein